MNERMQAFDALKGLLIVLVIMGHVLLGSITENLGREIIYFFHMPIFLAVTGYFTKQSLIYLTIFEIFKKLKPRMIIPFLLAFTIYTTIILIAKYYNGSLELKSFIALFLYPYYHLWYIPAVVLFVLYTKILELMPKGISILMLTIFSLVAFYFEGYGQNARDGIIYHSLGDKRFYYYFIYFYVGYYFSSRKFDINRDLVLATIIVGLMVYGYAANQFIAGIGKAITNVSLILYLFSSIINSDYHSTFLAKIGRVSLPIYLWHVLPLIALKKIPMPDYSYYLVSVLVFASLVLFFVKLEGKTHFLDRYLYGVVHG
jgi:fucose 4-O-acetylase-like acetyltransferase